MFGVVGLDLSLTCPAAVELDDDGDVIRALVYTPSVRDVAKFERDARVVVQPKMEVHVGEDLASWHRIRRLVMAFTSFAWGAPVDVVGIEDHAPGGAGAQSKSAPRIAHLQGIVRHELNMGGRGEAVWSLGPDGGPRRPLDGSDKFLARPMPFLTLEPNVVKAFATGSGIAKKPALVAAAVEAGFFQLSGMAAPTAEGLADAYWIARATQTWLLLSRRTVLLHQLAPRLRELFGPRKGGKPGLAARELMR